jgi:hypothetical protein
MKRDFQKFQNDFYAEVEKSLPKFYKAINALMVVCDNNTILVTFNYKDVTGKEMNDGIEIHSTMDASEAVMRLNAVLADRYPAWAEFDGSLESCIVTAMDVDDSENTYNVTIEPQEKGEPKLVYVTVHHTEFGVEVEHQVVTIECPEVDYTETFNDKVFTPEEIESAVRLDIFGE